MSDEWQFFPCSMGDDQAFIFVDVGASDTIATAPSSLAELRLKYKAPNPNGLPTSIEFDAVKTIEDRIATYSKANGDWYVGRVTVKGHRFFKIYTTQGEAAWKAFVLTLSADSGYEIRLSFSEDHEHSEYRNDLYPTADDWQVIKDLRVIEHLEKDGDDGSQSRKVDHWIYFADKASSIEFVIWAEGDRFTEDPDLSRVTDDGKYCVRLHHHGTIKIGDISSHTIALKRKAAGYGGDYDGWETPVLKQSDNPTPKPPLPTGG